MRPAIAYHVWLIVFVTKYGKKYHRRDCHYMYGSRDLMQLVCAQRTLEPCKVCRP